MPTAIIPYEVAGLPDGASSPKEAVINEINNSNKAQNEMNKTFGGKKSSRGKSMRKSMRGKRMRGKRSRGKSMKSKSMRGKRSRGKSMHKKRSIKKGKKSHNTRKIKIVGGEELSGGEEVTVPQFPGNKSGPLNPNAMSAKFNSVLLESQQGAAHDGDINK
jgi:hypothetical protein